MKDPAEWAVWVKGPSIFLTHLSIFFSNQGALLRKQKTLWTPLWRTSNVELDQARKWLKVAPAPANVLPNYLSISAASVILISNHPMVSDPSSSFNMPDTLSVMGSMDATLLPHCDIDFGRFLKREIATHLKMGRARVWHTFPLRSSVVVVCKYE